jgi:hypothetical protein
MSLINGGRKMALEPSDNIPAVTPQDIKEGRHGPPPSDVEQRIIAAIKLFDERLNRTCIGENVTFEFFTNDLRLSASSLLLWITIQEMITQKDHLTHAHLITEWMHHMVIKFFTYRPGMGLKKSVWSNMNTRNQKQLLMMYHKFRTRATPHQLRCVREAFKPASDWNMPYWNELKEIWSVDPNLAQNIWKKVFPD